MKNQYFGDVNDYRKYGLLRLLSHDSRFRIGVCWMLTANDHRTDGNLINYLNFSERWRHYDPALFDLLQKSVRPGQMRHVSLAENAETLPGAHFFTEPLADTLSLRVQYFKQAREKLAACDLIFYDPDNGIEIKSKAKGQRDSAKYIFWDEVTETFQAGHSVLVYQHFPREKRNTFIERLVEEYQRRLNASKVYWFRTPQVVYLLSVQAKHIDFMASRIEVITSQWHKQILSGQSL